MKKALITGVTGQDGSYLAELLLEKGYEVYGIQRRTSTITTGRIDRLLESGQVDTRYADLADANSILFLLDDIKPDEVYNIGSMSHVRISFEIPEYTAQVTGIGPLRILEGLRFLGAKGVRFYQASSSEMFGSSPPPQNEGTAMLPVSPYGASKLFAYHMTRTYRAGYGMFAANGILFNHESPRRGINFVTQKIIHAACRIKLRMQDTLSLGNIEALRDWGHAKDYMRAVWMILQHHEPDDFVVATQHQYSVREFADLVFKRLDLNFYDYLVMDEGYKRPNEVPSLLGDASKIRRVLGWEPAISFEQLVEEMIETAMKEETIARDTGQWGTAGSLRQL